MYLQLKAVKQFPLLRAGKVLSEYFVFETNKLKKITT